jgi:metal-responsive CopG/Arc/MetJ family transcriptional regulator
MKSTNKVKLSVSVGADVVACVDRQVSRQLGGTRSQVIEQWLRRALRQQARDDFDAEILAYYDELTAEQQAEDRAIAAAAGRAVRRLDFEPSGRAPRGPGL